jgi:hypothetical protein
MLRGAGVQSNLPNNSTSASCLENDGPGDDYPFEADPLSRRHNYKRDLAERRNDRLRYIVAQRLR